MHCRLNTLSFWIRSHQNWFITLYFIPFKQVFILFKLKSLLFDRDSIAQLVKNLQCRRPWFSSWVGKIPSVSSVWSLNRVRPFATPWSAAHRASLSSSTLRACSNSCPLSWRCHPTISSSIVPFSSCLQSFPASGSFQMSQFFSSGGHSFIRLEFQLQHQSF